MEGSKENRGNLQGSLENEAHLGAREQEKDKNTKGARKNTKKRRENDDQ